MEKSCIFALINKSIMKKRITQNDYIKANRKASREAEIEMYEHPICHKRVHESKKVYNRRKIKAADKKLPYFFSNTQVFNFLIKKSYSKQSSSTLPSSNLSQIRRLSHPQESKDGAL